MADWKGERQRARLKGFARLRAVLWRRSLRLYESWALRGKTWFRPLKRTLEREFSGVDPDNPSRLKSDSEIFGETPVLTVVKLLGLLESGPEQFVDLGSGRGLACLVAANSGYRARGFELEADWVARATRAADALGLQAEFHSADFLQQAWPDPAVVFVVATAYPPSTRSAILQQVRDMKPGSVLIAGDWPGIDGLEQIWSGPLPVDWGVILFSIYRVGGDVT